MRRSSFFLEVLCSFKPMNQTRTTPYLPRDGAIPSAIVGFSSLPESNPRLPATPKPWQHEAGAFFLAVLAVILTTFGLMALNKIVSAQEPNIYVRPYTGLYVLTVLVMTWFGGRRLGFFTLVLCLLASTYFLLPPTGWSVAHPSDWMGMSLLGINAGVVVLGFDGLRQKATLLGAASEARQESARLVQETIEMQARLQSVVEAAQEQRQGTLLPHLLLPELPNQVPGLDLRVHYESLLATTNSSTPFFDSFLLKEDLTALVVGTVANSGPAAMAAVAMTRKMLRSAVYRCATLDEAVTELNAMLVTHCLLQGPGRMFVGLYHASSQTMTSVSCGETLALVRRTENGQVQELAEASPLLGAAADTVYQERLCRLCPGDLVFLSPGSAAVTEVETEASRWKKAMETPPAVPNVQQWILHLVRAGKGTGLPERDGNLCLLAARVTESGAVGSTGAPDEI